jgi:ABC-type Zn uptake system ZnuABC Zn-binding protein ZnuA
LKHTIQELNKNNITVIIIEMPADPLAMQKISDTTKDNYFSFLNTTGVTYDNFQNRYPSSYFHDLSHMNIQGRTSFSHDMAKMIIQGVEK